MCRWLFLRQNVRVVNLSITHNYLVPSLSFNVSRSSGNSNSNLASVTTNFGLDLRQFDGTDAQSKMISNDQELIQSDPTSCPQNQKGNN